MSGPYTPVAWVHPKWLDRAFWAELRRLVATLDRYAEDAKRREAANEAA